VKIVVLLELLLAQNCFNVRIVASTSILHSTHMKWPRGKKQMGEQVAIMAQKTTITTMTKTN
jgi:hypothetical protein